MKNESGMILIDMLVVVVLSSIIAFGAGITASQIFKTTAIDKNNSISVRQAQNLGFGISQDLTMGREIFVGDNVSTAESEFVTIIYKEWESGYKNEIRYSWEDPAVTLKRIFKKADVYDTGDLLLSSSTTLIAEGIFSANLTPVSGAWKLTVEGRHGNRSATREYVINQRID